MHNVLLLLRKSVLFNVCDVAYGSFFGMADGVVSSRGSVLEILLEWETLHHPNAWTVNSFKLLCPLTLKNLSLTMCSWFGGCNDELASELDMLYAYLGWMHFLFVGMLKNYDLQ